MKMKINRQTVYQTLFRMGSMRTYNLKSEYFEGRVMVAVKEQNVNLCYFVLTHRVEIMPGEEK